MANTFRIGQFGLTSFDDHNLSLSDLIHHFNDNINDNFSDVTDPLSNIYTDQPAVNIATFINVQDSSSNIYTDVTKLNKQQRDALYTDFPEVSNPVYEDMIKNT